MAKSHCNCLDYFFQILISRVSPIISNTVRYRKCSYLLQIFYRISLNFLDSLKTSIGISVRNDSENRLDLDGTPPVGGPILQEKRQRLGIVPS